MTNVYSLPVSFFLISSVGDRGGGCLGRGWEWNLGVVTYMAVILLSELGLSHVLFENDTNVSGYGLCGFNIEVKNELCP